MNHTPESLAQRQANAKKMYKRKRAATHCSKGHSNWGFRKDGRRYCKPCKVACQKRNREERKNKAPIELKLGVTLPLSAEDRRRLKQKISEIQRQREYSVRRMHVVTTYGERLYLGGGSRPVNEQLSGYAYHGVDKEVAA